MYPFTICPKQPSIGDWSAAARSVISHQEAAALSSPIRILSGLASSAEIAYKMFEDGNNQLPHVWQSLAIVHYPAGPKNASEKPRQLHYVAAGPTRLLKDIVHWSSVTVCPLSGNVIRIIKSSCKLKPPLFLTECNIMVEYLLHWWNK